MSEKLRSYLDGLFASVPDTTEVREAKDELFDSMMERYEDCIREGMDEQAAYDCVIDSIGDIHELFDELDFGQAGQQDTQQKSGFDVDAFVRNVTDYAGGFISGLFSNPNSEGVRLMNTVSVPLEDISGIDISYIAEPLTLGYAEGDELVINEYMNRSDPWLFCEVSSLNGSVSVRHGRRNSILGLNARIEILLPAAWSGSLQLSTVSGKISVVNSWTFSAFEAKTVSGSIDIPAITTRVLRAGTTSGAITVNNASGEMDLHSVSGAVHADGITGGGSFRSTSGSVRAMFTSMTGHVKASSVSGGIRLGIPTGTSYELEASSVSGNVHAAFEGKLNFFKRNKVHGFCGEAPYLNVKVNTTSGGIHIND